MNIYELMIYVIAMHSAVNKIYCLVSFSCKIHMLGSHNMKGYKFLHTSMDTLANTKLKMSTCVHTDAHKHVDTVYIHTLTGHACQFEKVKKRGILI